jgi:Flp pilus assembly protein TadD
MGDLAWQLATQPDAKIRNGAEAVQLATQACDLTSRTNAQYLESLSAAYAETGHFDEAVASANQAIALADKAGEKDVADAGWNLIQHYQSRQPYRQEIR